MGRLRTTLKWGFRSLLVLLFLLVAAWAVSRAMYPTEAQREAIAEMERQPDHEGKNAFALLWTLDRDVPDDELDAVMAEDARKVSEWVASPELRDGERWGIESAAERYPDLSPDAGDRELFCNARDEDCLARVREDLDTYNGLVERHRKLLDRIDRLGDYEYLRSEFPHRMSTPVPSYQAASLIRTRRAVQFANGEEWEAVAGTCRDLLTWRRLGANSDTLIGRLIGVAYSSIANGHALANMLAELPTDTPLPAPCSEALAPPTLADVSACNAMRGEFALSAHAVRHLRPHADKGGALDQLLTPLMFDAEATVGMSAEAYRSACSQAENERLRADERDVPQFAHKGVWRLACIGNAAGCMLNAIAGAAYTDYRRRLQDHGARLRVLGTLAWMRRHAGNGRSPAELLAARPDDLESPARAIEFGPEGRTLRVPLYDSRRGEHWSIPLPSSLQSVPKRGD